MTGYCIRCGTATNTVHDYRNQKVKDIPSFGKMVTIDFRKRRYCCPHCGKMLSRAKRFSAQISSFN